MKQGRQKHEASETAPRQQAEKTECDKATGFLTASTRSIGNRRKRGNDSIPFGQLAYDEINQFSLKFGVLCSRLCLGIYINADSFPAERAPDVFASRPMA